MIKKDVVKEVFKTLFMNLTRISGNKDLHLTVVLLLLIFDCNNTICIRIKRIVAGEEN